MSLLPWSLGKTGGQRPTTAGSPLARVKRVVPSAAMIAGAIALVDAISTVMLVAGFGGEEKGALCFCALSPLKNGPPFFPKFAPSAEDGATAATPPPLVSAATPA